MTSRVRCASPVVFYRRPSRSRLLITFCSALLFAACRPAEEAAPAEPRPVRVVVVDERAGGDEVSLTGTVQAQTEVNLAFRIDGRMIERKVNVGDMLTGGQLVAELDPQNEQSGLQAARANLSAAQGQLVEARNSFERFRRLVGDGVVSQAEFEQRTQVFQTAQAQVEAARAQVDVAENRLRYTRLIADSPGAVTAIGAEPGEVVAAGRMIVQIAREGGLDAVFDVPASIKDRAPENPEIAVALSMQPGVTAAGRVREVSPRADPVTGTWQVRVGLTDPPAAMRMGATVTGRMRIGAAGGIEIPAQALMRAEGQPAVWVVDPDTQTVAQRAVEVLRFDPAVVVIGAGLAPGDRVVTAGVQALLPGQQVRLVGAMP